MDTERDGQTGEHTDGASSSTFTVQTQSTSLGLFRHFSELCCSMQQKQKTPTHAIKQGHTWVGLTRVITHSNTYRGDVMRQLFKDLGAPRETCTQRCVVTHLSKDSRKLSRANSIMENLPSLTTVPWLVSLRSSGPGTPSCTRCKQPQLIYLFI